MPRRPPLSLFVIAIAFGVAAIAAAAQDNAPPVRLRGTGEGHYDWDLRPGSSMTNATVVATVSAANGQELELSYKGGTAKVRVPPGAPIVTLAPAERAEVKSGVAVFAVAKREADGSLSVLRMVIGRNGVKPPM